MPLDNAQFHIERRALLRDAPIPFFDLDETIHAMQVRVKPSVTHIQRARDHLLIQPRSGVADHEDMVALLSMLENTSQPDIMTLTIDSYTRLNQYEKASADAALNGYPLIYHGRTRAGALERRVVAPLQVRHGSPDGRLLAEVAYAAGITAFEGGGISYNIPYSKSVPLATSLDAWRYVDRLTALISEHVVIDRETFGTLTAVLIPPSLSIAISILEMLLAAEQGVRCMTIGFPQTGSLIQDVAALQLIPRLCRHYLGQRALAEIQIFTSYHQWMGVFPQDPAEALAVMSTGVIAATLGHATKLINKTHLEAQGIPSAEANATAVRYCRAMHAHAKQHLPVDLPQARIEEESMWMAREVDELLQVVFDHAPQDLRAGIIQAFADGTLDIPFAPSRESRGLVMPCRAPFGAIRYLSTGNLPFTESVRRWNQQSIQHRRVHDYAQVLQDIHYFAKGATL
jgi:methylaspartate mutase epsilon subunit